MRNLYKDFSGFNAPKFEVEIFGVGNVKGTFTPKPGWTSWGDVKHHYGLGSLKVDEYALREGYMSRDLHDCLTRTLGDERMSTYFPAPPKGPRLSTKEQEIDDLVTMMFGSVAEVGRLRNRKK